MAALGWKIAEGNVFRAHCFNCVKLKKFIVFLFSQLYHLRFQIPSKKYLMKAQCMNSQDKENITYRNGPN